MAATSRAALVAMGIALASAQQRPNFIWIMSDDLGYGEISRMPGRTNTNISTPNIDALLESGVTFTDAYAGEAVCAPSRSTLLTGRHTGHATIRGNYGVNGHDLPLPANETTFLQVLQASGYHVACVGKWGMGWYNTSGAPHRKGCSEYYGVLDQNYAHNMYPTDGDFTLQYPDDSGKAVYQPLPFPQNANASRETCMAPGNGCVWTHDLWTARAMQVLQAQATRERELGAAAPPLFLYLAYTDPHAGGWSGTKEVGNPVPSDGRFAGENGWPDVEKDHASAIETFQDRDVGTLVAALDSLKLRDHTAVAFASDNGASNEGKHDYAFFGSSGPLRGFKRCLTEGGIRTPMGFSWPGVIPANVTTNYTTAFWDMLPTILDMANVPSAQWPADIDGISIWPLLQGKPTEQPEHPPLYWEFCTSVHPPGTTRTGSGWGHAVRMGQWKGVSLFEDEPLALYDLSSDIGETTDVAASHPHIVEQMNTFAKAAHVDSPIFPVKNCVAS